MTWDGTFDIPSHIVARKVEDEIVILDLKAGTYFSLDPVGARIWQHLSAGKTLSEINDLMQEEFEVTREQIEADSLKLTNDLVAKGLLKPQGASPTRD